MFEQATILSGTDGRRAWTTGIGFAGEALALALILIAPMAWPQVLPKPQMLTLLMAPPVPVAPPIRTAVVKPRSSHTIYRQFEENRLLAPKFIPRKAAVIEDEPPSAFESLAGLGRGDMVSAGNELLDKLLGTKPVAARPAEKKHAEPKEATAEIKRVKVGGDVRMARLLRQIQPEYPSLAKQMHVAGVVELTGVIGIDGRIRELKATSGNPLLVKAALDAVRQWIYEPTLLNGQPVEVIAPITVTFRLN